jgi:hypothetical protein
VAKKGVKRAKRANGSNGRSPKVYHVHAISPERDRLEIRFPHVEGYAHRISATLEVAWDRVPVMTLDPLEIPDEVRVKGLSTEQGGRLSLMGPGATDEVTLEAWRRERRLQEPLRSCGTPKPTCGELHRQSRAARRAHRPAGRDRRGTC